MKLTLAVLLLAAQVSFADQAVDSFFTRFANALVQKQERQEANDRPQRGHYDARDNYGNLGNFRFETYTQCMRYANSSQLYHQCVWVEE